MPKLSYSIPPPSLMRELREVESDAGSLVAELVKANRLPSDFPADQLQELLVELQSLPGGTAEGCREPLEYARARLPAIRRQFIQTEEESRQPRANEDEPPPLSRGMTIDVRIGALVNSVTTALDEYRALASIQDDDAVDTAPSLAIDATSEDAVDAMAASQRAERALGEHVDELERIAEPASVTADNLKRQMRDTRRLLSLARIELRMPAFVPRWYRKTINAVRNYPRILRATATAVRMGVDVARPMFDAWHRFERGYSHLVLDTTEHAATGLSAVTRKWEVERAGRRVPPVAGAGTEAWRLIRFIHAAWLAVLDWNSHLPASETRSPYSIDPRSERRPGLIIDRRGNQLRVLKKKAVLIDDHRGLGMYFRVRITWHVSSQTQSELALLCGIRQSQFIENLQISSPRWKEDIWRSVVRYAATNIRENGTPLTERDFEYEPFTGESAPVDFSNWLKTGTHSNIS